MIAVGHARDHAGRPAVVEKAGPDSELVFGEWGPSDAEEARAAGLIVFFDGMPGAEHRPNRRYSHSTGDL